METALISIMQTLPGGNAAPDWVHLIPAGTFSGADGRGPFTVPDMGALISASMNGRKLPIDVNHAIDLRGSRGEDAPAVGWIVSLEARGDGLWGKVEWTERGRQHMAAKDYGFLSPVLMHTKDKPFRVGQILRASLTNDPNLTLTALHTRNQKDQTMEKELREALGLPETADQAAILAAAKSAHAASTAASTTLAKIAEAAGAKKEATADEIVTTLNARKPGSDAEKTALEDQVKQLNQRLTDVVTTHAKERAEAAIDKAIEETRLVPALRDRYIARHMREPAEVEAELKLMPSLNSGGLKRPAIDAGDGATLNDTDAEVVAMMGLDPKAFAAQSKLQKEAL